MAAYRRLLTSVPSSTSNYLNYSRNRNSVLLAQPCATVKTRSIEKKLGIPPRPKRPVTPYLKFTIEQRPNVMRENPLMEPRDVMRKLGEMWKTVTPDVKEDMRKAYVKELEEHTKRLMAYDASLTHEQKQSLEAEKCRVTEGVEKNKMKSKLKELGKPKKPPTTFILYMMSQVHTKNKDMKFPDWMSVIAKEWNAASPEVKTKYETETKKLMEQYQKDMINWEEKMIKLGHIDVVRKHVLMDLKGNNIDQAKIGKVVKKSPST